MLYRVAQIQLSMLSPPSSNWMLPLTPNAPYTHRQGGSLYAFVGTPTPQTKHRHIDPTSPPHPHPTQTEASSRPTYGAVLSVPARAAFAFAVLASAVFIAARVTRPLVAPGAHPAVVTATGARNTNAMATTVGCTNLCGRQEHRKKGKDKKKEWMGEGGGFEADGIERKDEAVMGQGDRGGREKTNPEVIVRERRPRSTTLSDGS